MTQEDKVVKVRVSNVTKQYQMAPTRTDKVKSLFYKDDYPDFWALQGVDFEAYEGETIAIVGTNGSGKSTLMKIISGIVPPTTGKVTVNGEVSLIAINAGLRGGMTGRDNIRLKGMLMGMTDAEIDEKMADIIDFSELGPFIDQQVKNYSSGMKSKLGFAISAYSDPDILIIDEALSVGDATFAKKSFQKIKDFKAAGKTIFFVSHSMGQVKEMADRVIWLDYGQVRSFDKADKTLAEYKTYTDSIKKLSNQEQTDRMKNIRQAQLDFSLDKYFNEKLNDANQRGLVTRSEREKLYRMTHHINGVKKLNFFGKVGLTLFAFFLLFMADKIVLNMSFHRVFANPTHLVTNWRPSVVAKLNRTHGRSTDTPKPKTEVEKHNDNKTSNNVATASKEVAVNRYQVKDGDTLDQIAKEFHTSVAAISTANNLNGNFIAPGQYLDIPAGGLK